RQHRSPSQQCLSGRLVWGVLLLLGLGERHAGGDHDVVERVEELRSQADGPLSPGPLEVAWILLGYLRHRLPTVLLGVLTEDESLPVTGEFEEGHRRSPPSPDESGRWSGGTGTSRCS